MEGMISMSSSFLFFLRYSNRYLPDFTLIASETPQVLLAYFSEGALTAVRRRCLKIFTEATSVFCIPAIMFFALTLYLSVSLFLFFLFLKDAEEYADLPVRHNEDQMNCELAKRVLIQLNPHSFDSSHSKANLLLQAHFGHAILPCPDYVTDTKTVLDQSVRICQVHLFVYLFVELELDTSELL